jgi:hypothetical protein
MQPKLIVGQVNDPLEHEADRIADQVMRIPDPRHSMAAVPPQFNGKFAAHEARGSHTSQHRRAGLFESGAGNVHKMLRSRGQPLDTPTRAFFESRFGHDFSHVRVHAGANAAASAQMVGAQAYAVGPDLVFAEGKYAPHENIGQRLLAHELSHVVQQSGGAPGMARPAPVGIQRSVQTLGGKWDTDTYALVNTGGKDIGVTMDRLHFKAEDPVDATKIGLTQMVNSIDNGSPIALNPTVRSRSIPADKPDAGSHIDRLAERSNPIYGMENPTDTGKTLGGSVPASNSQWGYHYKTNPEASPGRAAARAIPQHQDATLYDKPTLPAHGPNASQLFETSALAVEGRQAGTFYGSVRWGWRADASNKVTIEPLAVVSVGVPSATFTQSATLWNAGKTSTGADTVHLPIAAGSSNALMPSAMKDGQISARLEQIANELLTAPHGQTTQTLEFERRALEDEQRLRKMGDFPKPAKNSNVAVA